MDHYKEDRPIPSDRYLKRVSKGDEIKDIYGIHKKSGEKPTPVTA